MRRTAKVIVLLIAFALLALLTATPAADFPPGTPQDLPAASTAAAQEPSGGTGSVSERSPGDTSWPSARIFDRSRLRRAVPGGTVAQPNVRPPLVPVAEVAHDDTGPDDAGRLVDRRALAAPGVLRVFRI